MEIINLASLLLIGGDIFKWMNNDDTNEDIPLILQEISPAVLSFEQHSLTYNFDFTDLYKLTESFEHNIKYISKQCTKDHSVTKCYEIRKLEFELSYMKEREDKIEREHERQKTKSLHPFKETIHDYAKKTTLFL